MAANFFLFPINVNFIDIIRCVFASFSNKEWFSFFLIFINGYFVIDTLFVL